MGSYIGLKWRGGRLAFSYTICFCRHADRILMLFRHYQPHRFKWNGLGGKLEPGESPSAGVFREVMEESNLELGSATSVRFAGLVTWSQSKGRASSTSGMYAFIADFEDPAVTWAGERATREGRLSWKQLNWVCDPGNPLVVENIPFFLPPMLDIESPGSYHCTYSRDRLIDVYQQPLDEGAKGWPPGFLASANQK